jgi:hypothetical protein
LLKVILVKGRLRVVVALHTWDTLRLARLFDLPNQVLLLLMQLLHVVLLLSYKLVNLLRIRDVRVASELLDLLLKVHHCWFLDQDFGGVLFRPEVVKKLL